MNNSLKAKNLNSVTGHYHFEFQILLSKIVECYKIMLIDNVKVPRNSENKIRDSLLLDYLNNNKMREKVNLTKYLFNREVPEDNTKGRTDIKVQTQKSFNDTSAYYIIECKRLDDDNTNGKTGLNGEYVKNGIMRFVDDYYSTYYGLNGMIGFIVDKMDIHKNIEDINNVNDKFYSESNTEQKLEQSNFIADFDFHYSSKHITNSDKNFTLYHLMLDFSDNLI